MRALAVEPETRSAPRLSDTERDRLARYVDRFNARDFDAVRAMLAAEVTVEVVATTILAGAREAVTYFANYTRISGWRLSPALVDGSPGAVAYVDGGGRPAYPVLLDWAGDGVTAIRDFRYARYVMEGAEIMMV